ncbi:MAG TPA: M1 family aminopeptidase, partial [Candidatus Sumerlaeota bacterium]|nr:M1 family aminopeptidase [Candidatus Sumerlaeota bacterium]
TLSGCFSHKRPSAPLPASSHDLPLYDMRVDLSPTDHRIHGIARIESQTTETLTFDIDAKLNVVRVSAGGAQLRKAKRVRNIIPSIQSWEVEWKPRVRRPELIVEWEGELHQDANATEAAGEIHNHAVRRTIGTEGVYLTGSWYPNVRDRNSLQYVLDLNKPEGVLIVANGIEISGTDEHRAVWKSTTPQDAIILVGGPHEIHRATHNDVEISVHLKPSQAPHAEGMIKAVKGYIDRYEPLLGPLPVKQYRVVDNFFSSGFAFSGFTLLSSVVIDMGERSQSTHGYVDHEFVHTWFGCGVHVDGSDGNWCEALTSYCTNHYGFVLDGNPAGARTYRRNSIHDFSQIKPNEDKSLATFGSFKGANRTIGYNKGAMVFHMLAEEIGTDAFFGALRRMNFRETGNHASWKTLQNYFEGASGRDLDWFFDQWVRNAGAPKLKLEEAHWDEGTKQVVVTLQEVSRFRAKLPVMMVYSDDRQESKTTTLNRDSNKVIISGVSMKPNAIMLDPDYDVMRRVDIEELIPTTSAARKGDSLIVIHDETERDPLNSYIGLYDSSYAKKTKRVVTNLHDTISDWDDAGILIVGKAASSPAAASILSYADSPITFEADGFTLNGKRYTDAKYSVLATLRQPRKAGCGITVVTGNSDSALPKSSNIPFYPNSIVVFENGRPVERVDLEIRKWNPVD